MKLFALILLSFAFAANSFAGPTFTCFTKLENDGYYVKKIMRIKTSGTQAVFVQPYFSDDRTWAKGGVGTAAKMDPKTHWVSFKGFKSADLFGELSEGVARSISLYLSPEVLEGRDGPASLYASGHEVGVEKGTYFCKTDKIR